MLRYYSRVLTGTRDDRVPPGTYSLTSHDVGSEPSHRVTAGSSASWMKTVAFFNERHLSTMHCTSTRPVNATDGRPAREPREYEVRESTCEYPLPLYPCPSDEAVRAALASCTSGMHAHTIKRACAGGRAGVRAGGPGGGGGIRYSSLPAAGTPARCPRRTPSTAARRAAPSCRRAGRAAPPPAGSATTPRTRSSTCRRAAPLTSATRRDAT